ncbi:MAG: tetratricopeptide repeat protein, partial [Bdellovibrionia bacterium]
MAKFKGTFKNGVKGSFSHSCSLVVLLMGASSCASLPTGGALNGSNQTGKGRFDVNSDAHAYQELEALYRKGLLDSTESRAVFFLKHYPKSAFVPSVENLRGLILLDRKKPEAAARRFEKALETHEKRGSLLEDSPESAHHHHYIYLNLATAQLALQHWDEANQALAKIDPSVMDALNRTKVGYLKAKIRDQQGFPLDAARQILTESESFTGSESPSPITSLHGSLR